MALNLAPFGRWTLRDKVAQRRLALRWAGVIAGLMLGAVTYWMGPLAITKVREIERGG
ncbi:MAG: hypothetical protein ACT4P9_10725 [Betaproteobacteria bacterium]